MSQGDGIKQYQGSNTLFLGPQGIHSEILNSTPFVYTPIPSLSGLQVYYDPTLGVTKDGSSRVSNWADQSGNANDATQSTNANKFVYSSAIFSSNLPGLLATASSSQFMTLTSAVTGLSAFTAVVVFKPVTTVLMQLLGGPTTSALWAPGYTSDGFIAETFDGSNYADFNDSVSAGTAYAYIIRSGTDPSSCVVSKNAVALTSAGTHGGSWSMGLSVLGYWPNGSTRYANAYFGPVAIYNRSISDGEQTQLFTWLHTNGWY